MRSTSRTTPALQSSYRYLLVSPSLAGTLLKCYDYPHPLKPHAIIRGYDKAHAFRTAKMCAVVAQHLLYEHSRVRQFQIACLLHDLGRAGLDRQLFGKIWSWARSRNIPTRPAEWRSRHPHSSYGRETEAFVKTYRQSLAEEGLPLTGVGMRASRNAIGICTSPSPATQKGQTLVGTPGNSLVAVDGAGDVVLLLP